MKRVFLLLLIILLPGSLFTSCKRQPQNYREPADITDNEGIIVSNTVSTIHKGEITITSDTDIVTAEHNELISKRLAALTSEWEKNAVFTAETTVSDYRYEYFDSNPKVFSITIKVTYNKAGIISLVCTLSYTYYGNNLDIFIGAETLWLEDGHSMKIQEILSCEKSLFENLLTLGITPLLNNSYPKEILNAGGHFSEICNFYIDEDGMTAFISYPHLKREMCDLSAKIAYYGNEELFADDIFNGL